MQSNILNIENWSSYKDEVGTHYTYKIKCLLCLYFVLQEC